MVTRRVIPAEEIERGLLLKHDRFGDVVVQEAPATSKSLVKVQKVSNNAITHVKRQELSWQ